LTFTFSSPTIQGGGNHPMALTRRQKEVLDFVADFVEEKGYCPSYEEIAGGLELASLATVHKHILALESKRYLQRGFNQSRSLEISQDFLAERRRDTFTTERNVPLLGRIAAGVPVESVANPETIQFSDFTGDKDTYALQVRGDSM